MKLQGVEILRISDFRRFFTIEEFILNKEAFSHLFSYIDVNLFCDTTEECALCSQVRLWCMGQTPNANFDSATKELIMPMSSPIGLGYMADVLKQYSNSIKSADSVALACICLLLGSYCRAKEAKYIYDYVSGKKPIGNFISVCKNIDLKPYYPLSNEPCYRIIYANLVSDKEVVIKYGNQTEALQKGECAVAIHTAKGCIALLPRTAYANDTNARLMINASTHRPYLKIANFHKTKRNEIEDVASFWIEPSQGIIYTTFDNKVKKAFGEDDNNFSSCYSFNQEYKLFRKCNPNSTLLAITKTNDYYTFYSTIQNDDDKN